MIVGRVFVVVFVVISVFWIPVIEANQGNRFLFYYLFYWCIINSCIVFLGSRLFDYIQSVTSFLAPPVCSVYVQAVLFKRINEKVFIMFYFLNIVFVLKINLISYSCLILFYSNTILTISNSYLLKGAFWGLVIGLTVGMARFIWQFSYSEPPCLRSYLDKRPLLITKVHFLHFGIFLFLLTCAASWVISLLTPPIPDKYVMPVYEKIYK